MATTSTSTGQYTLHNITFFRNWLFLRLGGGWKCGSGGEEAASALAEAAAEVSLIQLAGPWDMAEVGAARACSTSGNAPFEEGSGAVF